MSTRFNRGRIATRNGRPAYLIPIVRSRPPVTNREWQEQRQRAREADIFEKLFGGLLAKVKS
ncbi:hypothetical protein ACLBKU_11875 [Erythrobacter sp. NE805]|uniref:hypothetical protein n=1 Tax=Erythrobacter sp. NE805 TaxID=3389875 RepID=UPI00396B01EC